MMNVHAAGGPAMLEAAVRAVHEEAGEGERSRFIGVTVLTSLDRAVISRTFDAALEPGSPVVHLARLCQECGLDGVVAAAREAAAIREACGPDFLIVTPGIRRSASAVQDQKRVTTPAEALQAGADYLVIGRDVTASLDPGAAAAALLDEIESRP
jgi:orotidine-5'-phosphate decarboxylase